MRTIDVRLLVRGVRHPTRDILDQLVVGTLRVNAAVELIPDPRHTLPDGSVNPHYGRAVAAPPVHQNPRLAWQEEVRNWTGDTLIHDRARHLADRRTLAARFATQEATRAGAVDELVDVMERDERVAHARRLCGEALQTHGDGDTALRALATAVLAALEPST